MFNDLHKDVIFIKVHVVGGYTISETKELSLYDKFQNVIYYPHTIVVFVIIRL